MQTPKLLLTSLGLVGLLTSLIPDSLIKTAFKQAEQQTRLLLTDVAAVSQTSSKPTLVSPRSLDEKGALQLVAARDWTSGFFPGELWYLYEYTGQKEWADQARLYTAKLESEKMNAGTHDMGFKLYCSYGNGYRLTGDKAYRDVIVQGAKTLIKRFKPTAGIIRSWDHHKEVWQSPVIIDNMMNLELLFAATRLTGDSTFYRIAVTHARTTMKNHYRPDHSSYHVIDYDTLTGKVLKKNTHQGYSHESAWARGQAWGLYGYTLCYRETRDPQFLKQAEAIARYMLSHPHMPSDLIPYYDFDAPGIPNEPRDVSAATVMASGLYELSTYSKNGAQYRTKADQVMTNLAKQYVSPVGQNHGFILLHSTGSKPQNSEVDVPIIYADYYFLEALLRSKKLNEKKSLY
ncbi:glycoside hydrolase family 88 protein [Spirosoma validum]|uniref:Glycoside hydrolase family 88 protein n=1 Tax=Spirosoma validum TaxID=2771355 RepID=A0A927GGJ6_9BACT|nr:glycoside hydrolase family 88 protein [Spirosoma validum]MBD2756773.1 glycoside hydrolase family 88 protein [Spirosoma validum]